MPRKKTVPADELPNEGLPAAETGGEESTGLPPEDAPAAEGSAYGESPGADTPGSDSAPPPDDAPAGEAPPDGVSAGESAWNPYDGEMPAEGGFPPEGESPFPAVGDEEAAGDTPPSGETGMESDDSEYGALLQEFGEAGHKEAGGETPLTLDPPPGEDAPVDGTGPVPENDGTGSETSDEPPQSERPRGRPRRRESAAVETPAADPRRERVLTIEARDEVQTAEEREAIIWHEIQNAHWTRRILTGTLDGVERTESGMTVAVVNYKGFRVAIPVKEMMLFTGRLPSGAEFEELMARMRGILTARLGSEIDFIVKGHENKSRSVVASRRDAMYRKRQTFYLDKDERGQPMIYEGRVVQARVVAVAEKVVRVEVFGVECPILARGLSRAWVGNAADDYHVGQRILVRVNKISGGTVEDLTINADVRSTSNSTASDDLKKCVRQGRYAGRVTDVRGGVLYVRLNNGVNAIAHSCYDRRTPGKGDDVSFAVTRLDEEQGVAVGSITRIIKQNL